MSWRHRPVSTTLVSELETVTNSVHTAYVTKLSTVSLSRRRRYELGMSDGRVGKLTASRVWGLGPYFFEKKTLRTLSRRQTTLRWTERNELFTRTRRNTPYLSEALLSDCRAVRGAQTKQRQYFCVCDISCAYSFYTFFIYTVNRKKVAADLWS